MEWNISLWLMWIYFLLSPAKQATTGLILFFYICLYFLVIVMILSSKKSGISLWPGLTLMFVCVYCCHLPRRVEVWKYSNLRSEIKKWQLLSWIITMSKQISIARYLKKPWLEEELLQSLQVIIRFVCPWRAPHPTFACIISTIVVSGKSCCFSRWWYDQLEQLECSKEKDAVFCRACRHFPEAHTELTFARTWFSSWKLTRMSCSTPGFH